MAVKDLPKTISIRHLRCVSEVFRTKSASLAADRLNISPSAASKTIKEFEQIAGVKIFRGSRRGSEATAEGKLLIDRITIALTALDAVFSELPEGIPSQAVQLRIGALPIVSAVFLPEVLNTFARMKPRSRIEVISGSKVTLLEKLRQGDIDVVFARLPAPEDLNGLQFEQLFVDTYIFAVRGGHPIALEADIREIASGVYRLLLPTEETVTWSEISRFFRSHGEDLPEERTETIYLNLSQRLTETSDYIWIASELFTRDLLAQGRLSRLQINTEMLKAPIGLITRAGDVRRPLINEFARICRTLSST